MTHDIPAQGTALDRRSFLKLGFTGTALLGAAGLTASLSGCGGAAKAPAKGYYFLQDDDVALFAALIPVVHAGVALTPQATDEALRRIDGAMFWLQPHGQREMRKLLDLLHTPLLRRLTTGVRTPWTQTTPAQIEAFLARWRHSGTALLNAGYAALVKFVSVAWYAQAASQQVTGYPGPLKLMYEAVNGLETGA